jgi:tRNA(adenine34) deaminase
MQRALELAQLAADNGEVPVGALIVLDDQIIAEASNALIANNDPTGHAEIIALRQAAQAVDNYRLTNSTLYVSLEPCSMCAGALVHARVKRLVFAASDPKAGACGSVYDVLTTNDKMHRVQVESGLMAEQASAMLSGFFKARRAAKKAQDS